MKIAIIDPANLPSGKILLNNQFISREFKDFDGLPGEVLERACRIGSVEHLTLPKIFTHIKNAV